MEFIFGFYYGFDPLYIFITIGIMIVSMIVQARLKSAFNRYSDITNKRGLTGEQVARMILDQNGLQDIPVERVSGQLTDHYDPTSRTVRLSDSNFSKSGVASIAVAAHECGHAIQHKEGYSMLVLRWNMLPIVNVSSQLAPLFLMVGLALAYSNYVAPNISALIFLIGIVLFSFAVLFSIVTLPVEFNASSRALKILQSSNLLSEDEMVGGRRVLKAAAMTYIVAALAAISQLLYFILRYLESQR